LPCWSSSRFVVDCQLHWSYLINSHFATLSLRFACHEVLTNTTMRTCRHSRGLMVRRLVHIISSWHTNSYYGPQTLLLSTDFCSPQASCRLCIVHRLFLSTLLATP
jgi:hypothetical protein